MDKSKKSDSRYLLRRSSSDKNLDTDDCTDGSPTDNTSLLGSDFWTDSSGRKLAIAWTERLRGRIDNVGFASSSGLGTGPKKESRGRDGVGSECQRACTGISGRSVGILKVLLSLSVGGGGTSSIGKFDKFRLFCRDNLRTCLPSLSSG